MEIKAQCQELQTRLTTLDWVTAPIQVKRLSKDFHWFSPLLNQKLADKKADIAVKPRSEQELKDLVSECVELGLPLTVRGGGTGNYGQAVPLHGGVVVDMTRYKQVLSVEQGVVRVEPGIKMGELEEALEAHGYELRCMPSTYKMATIGGLFSGGFGGIGSINYGPLAAAGTVLSIKVMTIEANPQVLEFRGKDALTYHHTYGTNGIITEMEIAVAPLREWREYMLAFANLESAHSFANTLAYSTGIDKRNVALFDPKNASYFPNAEQLNSGEFLVIALCAENASQPLDEMLGEFGGRIAWQQSAEQAKHSGHTLMECCWNHSTLQALKFDKGLTYLQASYDSERVVEQLKQIAEFAPDNEVGIHLEFIKTADGKPFVTGLPLIQFTTEQRLAELTELHRSVGVGINDPHVFTLEDGKHHGVLSEAILSSIRAHDPHNLLNRGKVRSL